jgi:hypothetical protein
MSDDMAFYMTSKKIMLGKKNVVQSNIKLVEASFGNYKVSEIYEDKDQRAEILNFGVDNTKQRLMILTGIKNRKGKRDKYLSIYSLKNEKIMLCMLVENHELIGRLKSNLYNLVGGHIYYNNKVIKIRYDVIDHSEESWPENQVFDNYQNVLYLGANDYVQPGTPL